MLRGSDEWTWRLCLLRLLRKDCYCDPSWKMDRKCYLKISKIEALPNWIGQILSTLTLTPNSLLIAFYFHILTSSFAYPNHSGPVGRFPIGNSLQLQTSKKYRIWKGAFSRAWPCHLVISSCQKDHSRAQLSALGSLRLAQGLRDPRHII